MGKTKIVSTSTKHPGKKSKTKGLTALTKKHNLKHKSKRMRGKR